MRFCNVQVVCKGRKLPEENFKSRSSSVCKNCLMVTRYNKQICPATLVCIKCETRKSSDKFRDKARGSSIDKYLTCKDCEPKKKVINTDPKWDHKGRIHRWDCNYPPKGEYACCCNPKKGE